MDFTYSFFARRPASSRSVIGVPKLVVAIVSLGLLAVSGCSPLRGVLEPAGHDLRGLVVSVDGTPIEGARVETTLGRTSTGADGAFVIKHAQSPAWVSVGAVGFLGRTRAIAP